MHPQIKHDIRMVLFDLDGTLSDTAPDLGLALNMLRERYGMPYLPDEAIRPYASHGSRGLLSIGFGITPQDDDFAEKQRAYLALYEEVFTRAPLLFDGMSDVLSFLEGEGILWGVVTNKPRRFTLPLMQALNLHQRASAVVCGDDAALPKPAPDTLLMACQQVNILPTQCLYVGDAERDIEAGRAAGMTTVLAAYGYIGVDEQPQHWGADESISSPLELIALFQRLAIAAH